MELKKSLYYSCLRYALQLKFIVPNVFRLVYFNAKVNTKYLEISQICPGDWQLHWLIWLGYIAFSQARVTRQFCFVVFIKQSLLTLLWRRSLSWICAANQWTGFFMMRTSVISVLSRVQDSWCGVKGANIRIYEIYFGLKSVLFILNVEIYKKIPLLIIF